MRRWKGLLLVLVAVMVLTGITGSGIRLAGRGSDRPFKMIYIYKATLDDTEFWRMVSEGIRVGAEEFDVEYSIIGSRQEWDIEGNVEAVNRAIAMRPDAIVLAATDYERLESYAQKVVDAGILLLTLDSDVAGGVSRCFIGTDNYEIGFCMGNELLSYLPHGGPVAIISHSSASHTAIERVRGISDAVSLLPQCEVLPPIYCNNLVSNARERTLELLRAHPNLAGIAATNEMSAIGVAEALVEMDMQEQIAVVTCDHASRQIAYLEQGVIDTTIVQKPLNMGYFSVKLANDLLKNPTDSSIPTVFRTGYEVIDQDNYFTPENQKLLFPFYSQSGY